MGWDTERKIDFFETRCMYFLGYGLVLSLLFNLPGSIIYNITFSTFFIPIVVFNVMETKCEQLDPISIRFPVFDFQFHILRLLMKLTRSENRNTTVDKKTKGFF